MNPKKALQLLVLALNRGAYNDLELVGINAAVEALTLVIEPKESPK
jgi:hypothetical protein